MNYRIVHTTHYSYESPVSLSHNEARMLPRNTARQRCDRSDLRVVPEPQDRAEHEDYFGNRVAYFAIETAHDALEVTAVSEVQVAPLGMELAFGSDLSWEEARAQLRRSLDGPGLAARQYTVTSPMVRPDASLMAYAAESFAPGRPIVDAVQALNRRIYREFEYQPGFSTVATPLSTILKHRAGVCQDFAHLAIACLRAHGLAARYVSGYIETMPPPGQEKLTGADASHAWFSVYVPGLDWLDFDPTHDQGAADQHITVAVGRDYADVAPITGVVNGVGAHSLEVSVDVTRLDASV